MKVFNHLLSAVIHVIPKGVVLCRRANAMEWKFCNLFGYVSLSQYTFNIPKWMLQTTNRYIRNSPGFYSFVITLYIGQNHVQDRIGDQNRFRINNALSGI